MALVQRYIAGEILGAELKLAMGYGPAVSEAL
jgi:hypothetical protein